MASIKIRNLVDALMRRLTVRAANHNSPMEDDARACLQSALPRVTVVSGNLADSIRARIGPFGGVELEIPEREAAREPTLLN